MTPNRTLRRNVKILRATKTISLLTLVMLPFQNCGGGFELNESAVRSGLDGNNGQATVIDHEDLDKTPPNIAILSPTANAQTMSAVTVSGTCENGLDVALSINGGSRQAVACAAGSFSSRVSLTQNDGSLVIQASQTDAAGNTGTSQVTIIKDSRAPQIAISAPAQNATLTSQSLSVNGTCESGLSVQLSGSLLSAPAQVSCSGGAFTASVSTVSTNGSYQLSAAQTDAAGNSAQVTRNLTLNIPAGAPSIRITAPAANSATRSGITLSGTCTNGFAVRITGTGVSASSQVNCASGSFQAPISFSSGDGTKNIIASQTNAQNITGQDSRSFVLDMTAPAISILSPAAGTQAEASLTIGGSCETGLTVSISGAGVAAPSTTPCASSMFQASVALSSGAGAKAITVSQTDAVGNVGSSSRSFQRVEPVLDGAALYSTHCMNCHSPLISSTKTNRTASQISSAINSISQMSHLRGVLGTNQVQAIATALERRTDTNPFACLADRTPSNDPLRRLSREEYLNTLRDLLTGAIALSELQSQINQFPFDVGDDGNPFDRGVRTTTTGIFNAHLAIANRVGEILGSNATKRSQIFTETCFTAASVTDACLNGFIQRFGKKALRRPVETAEQTLFRSAYRIGASAAEGANFLIRAFLLHPSFLYHTEINGTAVAGSTGLYNLSAYELASRLSYLVTGSFPDGTLMAKADDQSILQANVLAQEATRLLSSAKAKTSFRRFYRQYLVLDSLKAPAYSNAFRESISLANLNEDAVEELLSFTDYVTFQNRSMAELLTSRVAFVKTSNLASLYSVSVGTSSDGMVTLPTNRSGVLSRAGFLLSGNDSTNPIHRGYVVRNSLLCDDIASPDPTQLPPGSLEHPPLDPNMTTRERWTQKTSAPVCMTCHTQINPLGFALEGFDGLGRARTTEAIFDSSGNVTRRLAVDTAVNPQISGANEPNVNGGNELALAMASSQKFNACFVKKWHQFAMRKKVNAQDGCMAAQLYDVLRGPNGTPLEMIKALINHPNFRQRKPSL